MTITKLDSRTAFASVEQRYPDTPIEVGPWRVERHTVSEQDARLDALRASFHPGGRYTPAGTYLGLVHKQRGVVMSAVPDEMRDHREPWLRASRAGPNARVLVNGLGLGMLVSGLLMLDNVAHIDVVEIDADVLHLGWLAFADDLTRVGGRVELHHADAYDKQWAPGTHWNVAWHDIWNTLCVDNLSDMSRLKRKYGRRVDWQGCWGEEFLKARRGR